MVGLKKCLNSVTNLNQLFSLSSPTIVRAKSQYKRDLIFSPILGAPILIVGVQIWKWEDLFELNELDKQ